MGVSEEQLHDYLGLSWLTSEGLFSCINELDTSGDESPTHGQLVGNYDTRVLQENQSWRENDIRRGNTLAPRATNR